MSTDLKNELNSQLSTLIREYQESGLEPEEISESLLWHSELARTRIEPVQDEEVEPLMAD